MAWDARPATGVLFRRHASWGVKMEHGVTRPEGPGRAGGPASSTGPALGPDRPVSPARLWARRAIGRGLDAVFLVAYSVCRVLPSRERVVLISRTHEHGNLAVIASHLEAVHPDVRVVRLREPSARDGDALGHLRRWTAFLLRCAFHLATSRVIALDEQFRPLYRVGPRPGRVVIQAWHGSGAFKKFGYSTLDRDFGLTPEAAERLRLHTNYTLCLVSSQAATPAFADAFRLDPEMFVSSLGIPRTDVLLDPAAREAAAARVRAALPALASLEPGTRVILVAPTFRGISTKVARDPGLLDLAAMRERLGRDHVILLKRHPLVRDDRQEDLGGFVIDASTYPDLNELMLVSDALVTDYSSAVFDFALLGRPIVMFAPDLESYERERGFYFDYRTGVPGPVFERTEEVADYLRAGAFDLERVRRFAQTWFEVADGMATARLVDQVVMPALHHRGRFELPSIPGPIEPELQPALSVPQVLVANEVQGAPDPA
jgi:teichoic acid ribitol-phosphate primase